MMNKQICIWILTFLFLVSAVTAWGVLPARQLGTYTTDTQQLQLTLRNTDYEEGYFRVRFEGDLAPYASYDGGIVAVSADNYDTRIPFTLQLDETVEPGRQSLKVLLEELPSENSDATVSSLLTIASEVVVNIPYQGDFVNAQLLVESSSSSSPPLFTITLLNKGDSDVLVSAELEIKGPTNQIIYYWTTDSQYLGYLDSGKITTEAPSVLDRGLYFAEVTLTYGDKSEVLRKEFLVGTREIISEGISAASFKLGEIIPIDVFVHNMWNSRVENVYAELFVLTKDGQTVQSFKTAPETITANSKQLLSGYWDTSQLLVGSYDILVVVHYEGQTTQKTYPVEVTLDNLVVEGSSLTGQVIREEQPKLPYALFAVMFLVIIALNILLLIYFKKSRS